MPLRSKGAIQRNLTNIPTKVKVYDVDKKELIAEFESINAAANFCGLPPGNVRSYIMIKSKSFKNGLNKTLCFR